MKLHRSGATFDISSEQVTASRRGAAAREPGERRPIGEIERETADVNERRRIGGMCRKWQTVAGPSVAVRGTGRGEGGDGIYAPEEHRVVLGAVTTSIIFKRALPAG